MLLSLDLRGLVELLRNVKNCYRSRRISIKIEKHDTIVPGEKGCKGSCFLAAGNWWKSNQTVMVRLLCKAIMKGLLTSDCSTPYFVGQVWRKTTILENIFFFVRLVFYFFLFPFVWHGIWHLGMKFLNFLQHLRACYVIYSPKLQSFDFTKGKLIESTSIEKIKNAGPAKQLMGKDVRKQAWNPSLVLDTHRVEEEKQFLQVAYPRLMNTHPK